MNQRTVELLDFRWLPKFWTATHSWRFVTGLAFATGSPYTWQASSLELQSVWKYVRVQFEPNSTEIRTVGIQGVSREMEVESCALPGRDIDFLPLTILTILMSHILPCTSEVISLIFWFVLFGYHSNLICRHLEKLFAWLCFRSCHLQSHGYFGGDSRIQLWTSPVQSPLQLSRPKMFGCWHRRTENQYFIIPYHARISKMKHNFTVLYGKGLWRYGWGSFVIICRNPTLWDAL